MGFASPAGHLPPPDGESAAAISEQSDLLGANVLRVVLVFSAHRRLSHPEQRYAPVCSPELARAQSTAPERSGGGTGAAANAFVLLSEEALTSARGTGGVAAVPLLAFGTGVILRRRPLALFIKRARAIADLFCERLARQPCGGRGKHPTSNIEHPTSNGPH